MNAANIVSALSPSQAAAMLRVEETLKTDSNIARILLDNLLARTFTASARHSIRLQARAIGL